jgi:hypothetical protein
MFIQNYRKPCISFLLLIVLGIGLGVQSSAQNTPTSSCDTKMVGLLTASGHTFTTHKGNVWSIVFDKDSLKNFKVIISTDSNNLVVIFVIVAQNAQMNHTPEFMQALLRANHDFDYVKVGFDNDGDLFVRADTTCRLLDVDELKALITQVASSANDLHKSVKGWISASK